MRRRRRTVEAFSISFLDVICCAFGAIILVLVLSKTAEPRVLEAIRADLKDVVADLTQQIFDIRGDTQILNRQLNSKREQVSDIKQRLARLIGDLETVRGEFASVQRDLEAQRAISGRLQSAKQELSAEMRRLLGEDYRRPPADTTVGGIPVDSEYIIFIIDTSGSMFNYAWELMLRKVEETLSIYPQVKGIQVMNDMGEYMFSQYAGKWIVDTPARRKAIRRRLATWNPFSNSSPVEGITRAIRTYYAPDKKISLYVFGDEFSTGSIEEVVSTVDRINREDAQGNRLVRIHAVGFPVQLTRPDGLDTTGIRFAALMRLLSERNGGTFVGLNAINP
jgi:hypothetical protein